ncbi:MAG: hypothetical protein CR982_01570 [Candidatus Cloacimonadota bacterium]|nr:MAG: hypothetical protein CR982_01570 [Candidatus Cloacimonadota bacterium]PIE77468.1 MAG: hypothetical protein CSA15_12870 [Candidatus Delongbacteria bacterium]
MKKDKIIDNKLRKFIKDFQYYLPIFYILLVFIGMLFSYNKYKEFGINIFQYSEISDFLITPFRDLIILAVTIFTAFLGLAIYKLNEYIKRFPRFYNSKLNFGMMKSNPIVATVILIVIYLLIFSNTYGKYNKKHFSENSKTVLLELVTNDIKSGKLIGKNNGYIFLMTGNNVKIVPIGTSIKEISIKK